MSIYRNKRTPAKIYRDVYIKNFGPIPREPNGRSYEIHHKDGNHTNNDPSNLVALTLQEHYDKHFEQNDFRACALMAAKLKKTPDEINYLIRLESLKRVANGTHHFLGENNPSVRKSKDGTHHFFNDEWQRERARKSVENGSNNFLGGEIQRERIKEGTHHFLGDSNPSVVRAKNGTHHWQGGSHHKEMNKKLLAEGNHSTQWKWTCQCGREGMGKSNLGQHQRSSKCSLNIR